jgi:AT hook motif
MSILSSGRSKFLSSVGVTPSQRSCDPVHSEPLLVKPKVAWKMLGCGNTRGYQLLAMGELESFLDGRSRKITVESIRNYVARRLGKSASTELHPKRRRGRPPKVIDDLRI